MYCRCLVNRWTRDDEPRDGGGWRGRGADRDKLDCLREERELGNDVQL